MIQDIMDFLSQADPEVGASIQKEFDREQHNIELIASENIVSKAVLLAMGTCLTNKYAEGYPGKRDYGGCYAVDVTEELARQRACQLFDCAHANVQPHSGANANLAAFFALLQPGDTVLSMNLAHGGHLSHGSPVNISGKYFRIVPYGVSDDTETIDYEQVMAIAKECRPKLILAGASAYPRTLDFAKFREIADAVGARLMVDMAHIAGLVAAGVHPSPIPYADVVTTTTHKTLRGPRGGMILCNDDDLYKKINSAVFPGTQGGPLEHIIAAKAVCLGEALKPEFRAYGRQVAANAGVLAEKLIEQYDVRSGQGPVTIARSMSGGNQQKAIIAREVDREKPLIVAVQPTRGLDVGAIEYIHSQLVAERDKGKAVLLVSLELDEVMSLSDRILVMYEGEIVGELDPAATDVQELGLYMAGAKRMKKEGEGA